MKGSAEGWRKFSGHALRVAPRARTRISSRCVHGLRGCVTVAQLAIAPTGKSTNVHGGAHPATGRGRKTMAFCFVTNRPCRQKLKKKSDGGAATTRASGPSSFPPTKRRGPRRFAALSNERHIHRTASRLCDCWLFVTAQCPSFPPVLALCKK